MKRLIDEYANLHIICNVRVDTVLYELPPARTGKKGRPRVRGKRLSLKDFALKEIEIPGNGYFAGCREVKTMLFEKRSV